MLHLLVLSTKAASCVAESIALVSKTVLVDEGQQRVEVLREQADVSGDPVCVNFTTTAWRAAAANCSCRASNELCSITA